jgi:hypothetical protein
MEGILIFIKLIGSSEMIVLAGEESIVCNGGSLLENF